MISKLILNFINNLTNEQYSNLVNGNGELQYADKSLDNEVKKFYEEFVQSLIQIQIDEEKLIFINQNLPKKNDMINFCKYYQIPYKIRETQQQIAYNILEYIDSNKEDIIYQTEKKQNIEEKIERISIELKKIMDVDEAKNLLKNNEVIKNKSNLLKLAKKLNVFVDRNSSFETIVENIIKSVVEAKIRSYTIRKKM